MDKFKANEFVSKTKSRTLNQVVSYGTRVDRGAEGLKAGFIHGSKPEDEKYYHKAFKAPLYLGVELEVEPKGGRRSDQVDRVSKALDGFVAIKSDGSLGPGGFEIVSLPATIEAHREIWEKFFDSKPHEYLESWSTGRCGLHIHVNRAALSDLAQGKLMKFANTTSNVSFMSDIAGRDLRTNGFCKASPRSAKWSHGKKISKASDGKVVIRDEWKAGDNSDRYQAINISSTNGGRTMEFRIFRGNVGYNGFHRSLEFVHSLCEFVMFTPAVKLGYLDFIEWFGLTENYSRFPELYKWMVNKKYLFVKPIPNVDKVSADVIKRRTELTTIQANSSAA